MKLFKNMRKHNQIEVDNWFQELDQETKQETAIKYLRSLDKTSLKNLYDAVDHYRQGDKILASKVKEPEPNEDLINLNKEEDNTPSDS